MLRNLPVLVILYSVTVVLELPAALTIHHRYHGPSWGHRITIRRIGGYLIALYKDNSYVCAGALINSQYAVTSAHCVNNFNDTSQISITGGTSKLSDAIASIGVLEYKTDESNKGDKTCDCMDLTIMRLSHAVSGPVFRPLQICDKKMTGGEDLLIYSWGYDGQSVFDSIHLIRSKVVSPTTCPFFYDPKEIRKSSTICAKPIVPQFFLGDDYGAPVIYNKQLCGLVAHNANENVKISKPHLYIDVVKSAKFIFKTIKSMETAACKLRQTKQKFKSQFKYSTGWWKEESAPSENYRMAARTALVQQTMANDIDPEQLANPYSNPYVNYGNLFYNPNDNQMPTNNENERDYQLDERLQEDRNGVMETADYDPQIYGPQDQSYIGQPPLQSRFRIR